MNFLFHYGTCEIQKWSRFLRFLGVHSRHQLIKKHFSNCWVYCNFFYSECFVRQLRRGLFQRRLSRPWNFLLDESIANMKLRPRPNRCWRSSPQLKLERCYSKTYQKSTRSQCEVYNLKDLKLYLHSKEYSFEKTWDRDLMEFMLTARIKCSLIIFTFEVYPAAWALCTKK